ncbi:hypothetical protein [Actinacidiphila oryziradicis]|uniref:M20/M25/M40 family metallo-hydrolase n=1 Tax=Actinacidiphila oryziradicis TaxID=2571141 RepID=A0A4U0T8C9_9ACTN|nr:hypothetical protein [Actinacidiphila oryziradicis]TKA10435.1 hypothetical protein FCI23_17290 [Actinacidiphila oryziradicis]
MARRGRRPDLGALSTASALRDDALASVTPDDILAALEVLAALPTPRGGERPCAERLHTWAAARWPALDWSVRPVGERGANLLARSEHGSGEPELLLCSHLDTSLGGSASLDWPVNGPGPDPATGVAVQAGQVRGFGLGVARAPAAAALVGYATAATALRSAGRPHRLALLLSGSGTHRSSLTSCGTAGPDEPGGVSAHLAAEPAPAAVIVAKCGPPGLLYEEPGAAYLRVRLRTRHTAVLARESAVPPGGLLAHTGTVCTAIEDWRAELVGEPGARAGQTGREAGIGAIMSGSPAKPDLLPAVLDVHIYLMTVPGDDATHLAERLRRHLVAALSGTPLRDCRLTVDLAGVQAAGVTPPTAPVAALAREVWERAHGRTAPTLRGWTGSTDGVLFRAAGIDTVRTGPSSAPDPADPRLDVLDVRELLKSARIYAEAALRWPLLTSG